MGINRKVNIGNNIKAHKSTARRNNFFSWVNLQFSYLSLAHIIYAGGFISIVNYICNAVTYTTTDFVNNTDNQTCANTVGASYPLQLNANTLVTAFIFKTIPTIIANFNNIKTSFTAISTIASLFVIYFLNTAIKFYEIIRVYANCTFGHTNLIDEARGGSTTAIYLLSLTNPSKIFDILIECCIQGNDKLTLELLKHIKDINQLTEGGNTALHVILMNHPGSAIIKLLLDNGINLNIQNNKKETALHLSISINKQVLIDILLNNTFVAIKTDLQDLDGRTPLHLAVKRGNYQFIKKLFNKDADHNIADNNGKKPIEYLLLKDNNDPKYPQMIKEEAQKEIAKLFQKWKKIDCNNLDCHKTKQFLRKLLHDPSSFMAISRESSECSVSHIFSRQSMLSASKDDLPDSPFIGSNNIRWSARVKSVNLVAHNANEQQTTFTESVVSSAASSPSFSDPQSSHSASPDGGDTQLYNHFKSVTANRKETTIIDLNNSNKPPLHHFRCANLHRSISCP